MKTLIVYYKILLVFTFECARGSMKLQEIGGYIYKTTNKINFRRSLRMLGLSYNVKFIFSSLKYIIIIELINAK